MQLFVKFSTIIHILTILALFVDKPLHSQNRLELTWFLHVTCASLKVASMPTPSCRGAYNSHASITSILQRIVKLTAKTYGPTTLTAFLSANLVLHRTIERIHVGKKYGDIPRGIFVVRGENVVLLGEIVSCAIVYLLAKNSRTFAK